MNRFADFGLHVPRILLPDERIDLAKWAVIACDQFTSEPQWWDNARRVVGGSPSTLNMIYPECRLSDAPPDVPALHKAMRDYKRSALTRAVDGLILVERHTAGGNRLGLVIAIDLECYDYAPGTKPLIRATEETVVDRLPPRVAIRRLAPLELSHVMLLADDPGQTLIEPLYAARASMRMLYDFELMQSGGRLRGWLVDHPEYFEPILAALRALHARSDGFLFAVGDGNHSLAAARAYWLELKDGLPPSLRASHPARYALVELNNLYDPALVFEPIHRAVFGADAAELTRDFLLDCRRLGMDVVPCAPERAQLYIQDAPFTIENAVNPLPVAVLQPFLDRWIAAHPEARIDYIHGTDALNALNACRIRLCPMDKRALFPSVKQGGALPRKTFSLGEARDKRYYLECRDIE